MFSTIVWAGAASVQSVTRCTGSCPLAPRVLAMAARTRAGDTCGEDRRRQSCAFLPCTMLQGILLSNMRCSATVILLLGILAVWPADTAHAYDLDVCETINCFFWEDWSLLEGDCKRTKKRWEELKDLDVDAGSTKISNVRGGAAGEPDLCVRSCFASSCSWCRCPPTAAHQHPLPSSPHAAARRRAWPELHRGGPALRAQRVQRNSDGGVQAQVG